MDLSILQVFERIEVMFLVFIRIISFVVVAPVFGAKNVPAYVKVAFSFLTATVIFWMIPESTVIDATSIVDYAFLIFKEVFVGWILGFSVYMVFSACFLAGQLIDYQIGFSMVSVVDPLAKVQVPITGNLYYFIFLYIFVLSNAHHYLVRAIVYSYELIPLGKAVIYERFVFDFMNFFTDFFILAYKLASPVIFVIFLINVALGILVRAAPQMNMFVVGIPIKLIVGLLTLVTVSPLLVNVADSVINQLYETMFSIIRGLVP